MELIVVAFDQYAKTICIQTIAVQAPSYKQQSIYRTGQAHTGTRCIHVRINI
jgi:hypothetical protein